MKKIICVLSILIILIGCTCGIKKVEIDENLDVSRKSKTEPLKVFVSVYSIDSPVNLFHIASEIFTKKYGIEVEAYP